MKPIIGKIISLFVGMTIAATLLVGCKNETIVPAHKIGLGSEKKTDAKVRGSKLEKVNTVSFFCMGASQKTMLGGKTTPVAGNATVKISLSTPAENTGAEISLTEDGFAGMTELEATADLGGELKVYLKIGDKPGVYKVNGVLENGKSTTAVFLGGMYVTKETKSQDGDVGKKLDETIIVVVEKSPGVPAPGVALITEKLSVPKKTEFKPISDRTDENGHYRVDVKLGSKQGKGVLGVRPADDTLGDEARNYQLQLKFFAVDKLQLIIKLLGGLAIFIFGMKLMSEGLSLSAGDKMKSLLNTLTKNRFAAAGAGVVTTGLIQSSSACTVMVIGFVNAGLMNLEQAIGVIMGSNIGTTVTAQMISFKLSHLALPAVTIGMIMMLVAKTSRTKFLAQILVGFGLLFFGMQNLAAPLKELKDTAFLKQMFAGFHCDPTEGLAQHLLLWGFLKAVFMGTVITVLVQSSSASIGLLLALASAGLIDPYTGFAVLLGTNIGTTITAVLASIGTGISAKRAACAHCLFNIMGTGLMIGLFFVDWPGTPQPIFMRLVSLITAGDNFAGENIIRYLANCHTLFNIGCTVMFIWFVPVFAKACRFIIGRGKVEPSDRKSFLEHHLVATPSIAIQQTWAELGYMLEEARIVHKASFEAIGDVKKTSFEALDDSVRHREAGLDRLQHVITEYIAEISMRQLNEDQGDMLPHLVHSVNDAERLGDHSITFLKLARRMKKRNLTLSEPARQELGILFATSEELFSKCLSIISEIAKGQESHDPEVIRERLDDAYVTMKKIKAQEKEYYKAHMTRQEQGECDVSTGIVFLEAIRVLQRSGAHVINIVEAASPLPETK